MGVLTLLKYSKNLLAQYFLLYMSVYLVALIGMALILFCYLTPSYIREIEKNAERELEYVIDNVDYKLKTLEDLAYMLLTDRELGDKLLTGSETEKMEGINELKKYKNKQSLLDDIILYYGEENLFYSTSGVTYRENFLQFESNLKGWNTFLEDINTVKGINVVIYRNPNSVTEGSMAIVYNFISNSPYFRDVTVIFKVSDYYMKRTVELMYPFKEGEFSILSEYDINWFTLGNKKFDFEDFIAKHDINARGIFYQDNNTVIVKRSAYNGLKYIRAVPRENLLSGYLKIQINLLISLFVLGLIGMGLALKFSNINYKPIKKIYNKLKTGEQNEKENEIGFLYRITSDIINENEKLTMMLDFQKPYIKRQSLISIIKGKYNTEEQLKNIVNNTGLRLNNEIYWVALITGVDYENIEENNNDVWEYVSQYIEEQQLGYTIEEIDKNYLIILVSHIKVSDILKKQNEIVDGINSQIKRKFDINPTFFVGSYCESLVSIKYSYIEALNLYKSRTVGKAIRALNEANNDLVWYPSNKILQYIQNVRTGNYIAANETLEEMMNDINNHLLTDYKRTAICYDLVNNIIKEFSQDEIDDAISEQFAVLLSFEDMDDLKNKLASFAEIYFTTFFKCGEKDENKIFMSVMQYIQENYTDSNLSLNVLAERMNKSIYYISRLIKSNLGCNFIEYLSSLRIEKSKILLTETNMNMSELVEKIGYLNVSSFNKKFKKEVGLSPGIYRKKNQKY